MEWGSGRDKPQRAAWPHRGSMNANEDIEQAHARASHAGMARGRPSDEGTVQSQRRVHSPLPSPFSQNPADGLTMVSQHPALQATERLNPQPAWNHPTRLPYRIVVLVLICNITFGSYYCYDLPGALKGNLFDSVPGMNQLQYNLMYSLYSWPNTVQVFFGGYIIDRYLGVRRGSAICCLVLVFGQALVCFGISQKRIDVVLAGRFLFGVGGETLSVAQSAYAAQWFKGAELATAFGIVLSFSRIGSAVNFDVSPQVLESAGGGDAGLHWAMTVGNLFCVASLVCCLLLNCLDYHAEKLRLDADGSCNSVASDDELDDDNVRLTDCLAFPLTVWLIFMVTITFYAAVFVFLQNGVQFVHQRYAISEKNSSFMMSLPYTVSALACPVFGYFVDKTGRAVLWILLSVGILLMIQLSFALWEDFSPSVGMVGMGLCYSICASALWPCISIVVQDKRLGMAYGLMTAFQNLGMAVFPIVISPLLPDADRTAHDTTHQQFIDMYRDVLMVFAYLAAGATMSTVLLLVADAQQGGWLNASAAELQQRDIARARRSHAFSTVPALYTHHVHSRNKYLSRLGIRPLGGPRLMSENLLAPGCLPSGLAGRGGGGWGYDDAGSSRTYRTTQSYDSSFHNGSSRTYRQPSDNGLSAEGDGELREPLLGEGEWGEREGERQRRGSWAQDWAGGDVLSASLASRGLLRVADGGESLLDWALRQEGAGGQEVEGCGPGSRDAAGLRGDGRSHRGRSQSPDHLVGEGELQGPGIPPLLGRVRGDSLLSCAVSAGSGSVTVGSLTSLDRVDSLGVRSGAGGLGGDRGGGDEGDQWQRGETIGNTTEARLASRQTGGSSETSEGYMTASEGVSSEEPGELGAGQEIPVDHNPPPSS